MSFAFSSSSDSEDDADRPISRRKNTEFFRQILNRTYEAHASVWPNELPCKCHFARHPQQANQSMAPQMNGFANSSMLDTSHHQMNGSRILDASAILDTTVNEEEFVLIKVGDKFQRVRVVTDTQILPSAGTSEQRPIRDQSNLNVKIESPPQCHQQVTEVQIPLERIDFTTLPVDPRDSFTDYCYLSQDEDSFPWTLPLPRFWREVLRQIEQNLNLERAIQGKPKFPTSYVKDRVLNSTQRLAQRPDPRLAPRDPRCAPKDPRLDKSLFAEPPRKMRSTNAHNQSVPNLKTSIFDAPSAENDYASSSSSSLSFSSDSEPETTNKKPRKSGRTFLTDASDDDDEDLSFNAFNNRKVGTLLNIPMNENFSPIRAVTKKTPAKKNKATNGTKNLLLEKPPAMNKDDILNSLTDHESDDDEFVAVAPIETSPKVNGIAPVATNGQPDGNDDRATSVPIATGAEAINILDSLIDSVPENMDLFGDDNCSTDVPIATTDPKESVIEMLIDDNKDKISNHAPTNHAPINPIASNHIFSSLNDNVVDLEVDGDGNCAPVLPKAPSTNDIFKEMMSREKTDGAKSYGDKNRTITPIATIPKNGIRVSRVTEKKTTVGVEKKAVKKKVAEKKVISKKVPTKDSKTTKTKIKAAEPKKGEAKKSDTKKAETKTAKPHVTEANETVAKGVEMKEVVAPKMPPVMRKVKRAKVVIVNMDFYEQFETIATKVPLNNNDSELSDEDFEDDVPCRMDDLTLPNPNTDREIVDKLKSTCTLCQYQAPKGWKQLTKHYVRKHPNCEIPISRLAKDQNPIYLSKNAITPEITENSTGLMIKSHCPICNEVYGMFSDKWLQHFIAHTGEYEYKCKVCHQEISQDLHKKCNSVNNDRINTHVFTDNVLYGYVCIQCKYIQLSKENVKVHLDREHQQININDENIVEIKLLQSSSKMYLMADLDSKLEKDLVEAKRRLEACQSAGGNQDDLILDVPVDSDDDDEVLIDLTLSDVE